MTLNKKISELNQTLKAHQPLSIENKTKLEKKFRLEFNYNTNHIEGNTISYSETELLLIFDDAKGDHSFRELEEMKGSDVAFHLIQDQASEPERPLTEQFIKNLNLIILVRPFWKDALTQDGKSTKRLIKVGEYKEHSNSVRLKNGEIFHFASPSETPMLMAELIDWFRSEEQNGELTPVELGALLHYKFVRIHPFDDGNGRISRLLLNYVLFKNGLPPIVIKTADKNNYLAALNRADTGDLDFFINYIKEQLIWSLEISIKAAKSEDIDEPGDLDKKITLLKQRLNTKNETITIKKSQEAILMVWEKSIYPLINKISKKLSEFDIFFKSKSEYLEEYEDRYGKEISLSAIYFKEELENRLYDDLYYSYHLHGFRNSTDWVNLKCILKFEFHQNVYDILTLSGNKFKIDKLYNQYLTDIEIEQIVEVLGTYIYDQIEGISNKQITL